MNAFFRGSQQDPPRQDGNNIHNPVMDFLRSVTGQPAMDAAVGAATGAAAEIGNYVSENFQMPQQFMDQQQAPPPGAPPPASPAAMRQLPTISVTADDLVDPSNRECCICFEENNIHDKVVRLPCAHIYHSHCISDWLSRHCTCPTCRYELPTEDPRYEAGRRERMKCRKPRYAKYELDRMSIRELKQLLPRRNSHSSMFSDKSDLIEYLISNEIVDLISAPPPAEFPSLAVLRAMGIKQLRQTMNETGVYYDPRDIVEKEDMVQIFVNSGRICLTETSSDDTSGPDTTYGHAPSTRQPGSSSYSFDDDENNKKSGENDNNKSSKEDDNNNNNEEDDNNNVTNNDNKNSQRRRDRSVVVETVGENDDDGQSTVTRSATQNTNNETEEREQWGSTNVMVEETGFGTDRQESTTPQESQSTSDDINDSDEEDSGIETTLEHNPTNATTEQPQRETSPEAEDQEEDGMDVDSDEASNAAVDITMEDMDEPPVASAAAAAASPSGESESESGDSNVSRKRERDAEEEQQPQPSTQDDNTTNTSYHNTTNTSYHRLSIAQLRQVAREKGVDLSNCLERGDMIERIAQQSQQQTNDLAVATETVQNWTLSQLKACGNAAGIEDCQHCTNQEDMIQLLLGGGISPEMRPRVVKIILALSPLMNMSTSQLRKQARVWNVNVADCLEKGEIVRRLANTAAKRAVRGS